MIDHACSRDMAKLYPGQSVYATFLNEAGKFVDDCIVYRTGPNAFMLVHGSGAGHDMLTRGAAGKQAALLFDDDLHDLSLQGPLVVDFLSRHVPGIRALDYFHHLQTRLFGLPVMISRTGYTGERGYGIFCKAADAPPIRDAIVEQGRPMGIIACAFTALDWLCVENCLLFYPHDNSGMYPFADQAPGDTLWEPGLDFSVSPGKQGFRGAHGHYRLRGRERFKIFGVALQGSRAAAAGDALWRDGRRVGTITCAMYSRLTQRSLAIARMCVDCAVAGVTLQARGSLEAAATAAAAAV